jgi:hypothetical protein
VTLALHISGGDLSELAGRITARLQAAGLAEDNLPDLAVPEPDSVSLASLVAAADAVLVDPASVDRPELARRARRLLVAVPDDLLDYAAEVRGRVSDPAVTS